MTGEHTELVLRFDHRRDDKYFIFIRCPAAGECRFPVRLRPAEGAEWHWDGNEASPTVSPSIDCHGGCGRHFTIVAGEAR